MQICSTNNEIKIYKQISFLEYDIVFITTFIIQIRLKFIVDAIKKALTVFKNKIPPKKKENLLVKRNRCCSRIF